MGRTSSKIRARIGGPAALHLLPLALPFGLLFGGGFILALVQSLGYLVPVPVEKGLAPGYGRIFSDPAFWASFGFSFYAALVSAALSAAFGAGIAYFIWKLPQAFRGLALTYKVPLILPHISVAFIILVLWSQSGFFSSLSHSLGLIKTTGDFPPLLYSGNGLGLILAYVYKGTAFAVLLAFAVLTRLDKRLLATATMLGASRLTVFFRVVLPHLYPVLNTTFIILFLYAFGAFDIPFLLSESYPGMLSIKVYNLYFQRDLVNRPQAMAILTLMFIFSTFFIYIYTRVMARLRPMERKL